MITMRSLLGGALGSVRSRLFILVLMAAIPAALLLVYSAYRERALALDAAGQRMRHTSGLMAETIRASIQSTKLVATSLAQVDAMRAAREPDCSRLLSEIHSLSWHYTGFVVTDTDGAVMCRTEAMNPAARYGDRDAFKAALATRRLAIGSPVIGRSTGKPVLPIFFPVLGRAGDVQKMIATSLDLGWLAGKIDATVPEITLPVAIIDREGKILYRHPEIIEQTDVPELGLALSEAVRRTPRQETVLATGVDGVRRVYGIAPLDEYPELGLSVAVGIAVDFVTGPSQAKSVIDLSILIIVTAVGLLGAWFVGETMIRRRIAELVRTAESIGRGSRARVVRAYGSDEFGVLAGALEDMARALERQVEKIRRNEVELVRVNRALLTLSECNQAVVKAQGEEELVQRICRVVTEIGGYRTAWVGYAADDEEKTVRLVAQSGAEDGYLERLAITWADTERGRGPTGTAIRTGTAVAVRDIPNDPEFAPRCAAELAHGYVSSLALPLAANGRTIGALNIYAAEPDAFAKREMELLVELSQDLAFGITALRTGVERERTLAVLRAASTELTRFKHTLDSTLDQIFLFDAQSLQFNYLNVGAVESIGYSREELLGLHPYDIKPLFPEPLFRELIKPLVTGEKQALYFDTLHRRKDGSDFPVEVFLQLVREDDGHGQFVAIVHDITERKRAEKEIQALNADLERRVAERTAELAQANVRLEEASRAKSEFLANMSHELRTPLNSIIGFSEMLKDGVLGELPGKQRAFVADIYEAGGHLLALINDILDLSKIEAGVLELDPGPVDVAGLLKASLLVVREKAMAHRMRLETRLDASLGTMACDERKLKQIVYNLLSNAVKFTADGGAVTLSARRCKRTEVALEAGMPGRLLPLPPGGEYEEFLAIVVEDSGIGIAEQDLSKLFEAFTQVDSSIARRHAGTGLGLSLVRRLAELHGGTVGVASRPGGGSTFSVWLPYRAAAPAERTGAPARPGAGASASEAPLALVVEDDDRMAELIAAQLHAEGFAVMRAATGEEGLVRAAKRLPQLITLDIFLPAMDGWEFMRRLKADLRLAATPVVIITISDDLDRGLALGARRVLQKPFSGEELVATLAGLVPVRPDGDAPRVLVVEDNVQAMERVAAALQAEDYRVLRAHGGAEAIEAAHNDPPELVILDLTMPEVSGFEVARSLRESERTARIPIVALTAKELSAEERARLNGNVSAVLAKASFSTSDLLAEVRRAIASYKAG